MANSNKQLEFVLKAVDEASAALNSVKTATANLQKNVDASTASMTKNTQAVVATKTAHENMTASLFKAVAGWGLLSKATEVAKDFLKDSVKEYLDSQQKLDLVRATVESMGQSFVKAEPQLASFNEKMSKLGVDGEDAELAAAKLAKMAGGDLTKGMQLAKMSSDLASSGFGDLNSNANILASVLAGRTTLAIRAYKLNLDATATTGQVLDAIQKKITQSTEAFAQTAPGKIKVVNEAFREMKETVGGALLASLTSATKGVGDMTGALDLTKTASEVLGVAIYETVQGFVAFFDIGQVIAASVNEIVTPFTTITKLLKGDFKGAQDANNAAASSFGKQMDALNATLDNMAHPMKALAEAQKELAASHVETGKAAENAGDDITNANKKATASIVSFQEKMKGLTPAFQEMLEKGAGDVSTLKDDFVKSMDSIDKSITKTKQSMADLQSSYQQAQKSDTSNISDQIVASQTKIADIKKQIAAATTDDQRKNLQQQLADEQKNLDSASSFTSAHTAEITEAQRRAGLTDLQRAIEDYNNKRALADQAYNEKLSQLQLELQAEQNQKDTEIALYQSKVTAISTMLTTAQDQYKAFSAERLSTTVTEVNEEIKLFSDLAQAIANVKSASASTVSTISIPTLPAGKVKGGRASGGSVAGGASYLVGELGPEIFTPTGSGYITPNNKIGGGQSIVVNITGNTMLSEGVAVQIADKVVGVLKRRARIGI